MLISRAFLTTIFSIFCLLCLGQTPANLYPKAISGITKHSYYTLEYSEKHEQPRWVFYQITPDYIKGKATRKDNFRADPSISTGSATPSDYDKSGYDRGHLCPAGSMKISQKAMDESFFMSNMSPQHPSLNRGRWNALETQEREWALQKGKLTIVVGPIFGESKKQIGNNGVTVPKAYYKVMYSENQMIGFILPNEKCPLEVENYAVTVDSIEKSTQIDFFHLLNDSIENKLESKTNLHFWFN